MIRSLGVLPMHISNAYDVLKCFNHFKDYRKGQSKGEHREGKSEDAVGEGNLRTGKVNMEIGEGGMGIGIWGMRR
jgi:hypothetical protein